jgi:pimeloyl-ACP methyl ester carboxylesterase
MSGTNRLAYRPFWCVLAVLSATSLQAQQAQRLAEPEVRTLKTKDDFSIKVTYYAAGKKEAAPVILLHDKDGNRFIWQNGFAEVLQKDGFAVVTVDLRHHGESRADAPAAGAKPPPVKLKPADYDAMWRYDLAEVKKFLLEQHHESQLNINKLAVVGPGMGAAVATAFAAHDAMLKPYPDAPALEARTPRGQDVRALVLISPDTRVPSLPIAVPLKVLRMPEVNSAYLVCGAKLNSRDKAEVESVHKQLATFPDVAKRAYLELYPTKLTSTEMIGKGLDLERNMLILLKKYCENADSQWRNRRPAFEEAGQ